MAAYHPRKVPPRPRSPPPTSSASSSHQNTDLLFPSAASAELAWSLVYPQRQRSVATSFSSTTTTTSDTSSFAESPRVENRELSPSESAVPLPASYWHDLGLPAHDGHGNFPSPGITPRASIDGHLGFHRPETFHRSLSNRTADTYSTIDSVDDGLSALDLNDGSDYGWDGMESVRNRSEGGSFGGGVAAEIGIGTGQTTGFTDRWRLSGEKRRRDSSPYTAVSVSTALSEEEEDQGREREQGGVHHHQQSSSRRISPTDLASTLYRRHSSLSSITLAGILTESSATPSSSPAGKAMTELLTTSLGSLFQLASSSILSFLPPTELSYKHSIPLRVIRSVWNIDEDSLMLMFPPPLPRPVEQPVFHELFLKPISAPAIGPLEADKANEDGVKEAEGEAVLEASLEDGLNDHDDWQFESSNSTGQERMFRSPWMPWAG
ncbi:hypothetical protein [Phaffia rhodozyma]|uniref:Uncharacterized protein n=1 Tax=Phaffia rhodozyma TaxID=264483 RepID=A0A0F7SLQ6_PHARH|nr:hypothetical protein [Phaffia rhodozyma]